MNDSDELACVVCFETTGPFTTQNYCVHGIHQICVECLTQIEKMTGSTIPPVLVGEKINDKQEVSCFGCGRRSGPVKKNSPTREVAINIENLPINEVYLPQTDWRNDESCKGILYRIYKGILILIPIVIMIFVYSYIVHFIWLVISDTHEEINKTCYLIGIMLTVLNLCLFICLLIGCEELDNMHLRTNVRVHHR